jgi:GTP-binding protein
MDQVGAGQSIDDIRNVALIAHVDHGKTTLADAMLWQSALFSKNRYNADSMMSVLDLAREKTLNVMPKITAITYQNTRINLVDIPSHADFGGAVERTLKMVDGLLLLVDGSEGPLPRTRFVLRKALEAGLVPLVVINKIDLKSARPAEVLDEIRELFTDLDASTEQIDAAVLYCNAQKGLCRREPDGPDETLVPLFEQILESVPPPGHQPDASLQFLISDLDYDDYLGRLALGRIFNGRLQVGQQVSHCRFDGTTVPGKVTGLYRYEGLNQVEITQSGPGDIVMVTGIDAICIGETLSDPEKPHPLPAIRIDQPTISITLSVNDSPLAGKEGEFISARRLRERLWKEILSNASLHVEETYSPDTFRCSGRGELQLAILLEMMRREGYEFVVGKPTILTRKMDGEVHEPIELLMLDCPEEFIGKTTDNLIKRMGRLTKMVNHGTGRVRMEFRISSRGLIGYRNEFLSDTKGTGIMNHIFDGYDPWQGDVPGRLTGVLIADRPGLVTGHAIESLQSRGAILVSPGDEVYQGMIVGENSRPNDLVVNITKRKTSLADQADVPPDHSMRLIPPRLMSLEETLEFIRGDELVEVTPRTLRLRKKVLQTGH